jgi:hypothetical protein
MNAAAARGLGVGVCVFILVLGQVARGEVYEVALPEVVGEYVPDSGGRSEPAEADECVTHGGRGFGSSRVRSEPGVGGRVRSGG